MRTARIIISALTLVVPSAVGFAPVAQGDTVAYLVNVTVRPGYNFVNADAALSYGYEICDKIATGRRYADIVADAKRDFATGDEGMTGYLIAQAVNELCPSQIWTVRNSAAHYRLVDS